MGAKLLLNILYNLGIILAGNSFFKRSKSASAVSGCMF
jgi:hypothetical protein